MRGWRAKKEAHSWASTLSEDAAGFQNRGGDDHEDPLERGNESRNFKTLNHGFVRQSAAHQFLNLTKSRTRLLPQVALVCAEPLRLSAVTGTLARFEVMDTICFFQILEKN
jgi:hypothetical protein